MARNRKRAKERRARRPHGAGLGVATAPASRAPDPIAHATPDVELVEAQLAVGRPEALADGEDGPELGSELDAEAEEEEKEEHAALDADGVRREGRAAVAGVAVSAGGRAAGAPAQPGGAVGVTAQPGIGMASRLVAFLQGSWRELQRVQWPDRRQVVQATSVVIGFVIVAGVFLWVADILAGHIVTFVLNGHW